MSRTRDQRRAKRKAMYRQWAQIARIRGITDANCHWGMRGWIVRMMENMPTCSDPSCCGNPRRLGHKTRQELKSEIDEKEQTNG